MLIKVGFEIAFHSAQPAPMVLMLFLHPSRELTACSPDRLEVTPAYLRKILAGAREHGLPEKYIHAISVEKATDQDRT